MAFTWRAGSRSPYPGRTYPRTTPGLEAADCAVAERVGRLVRHVSYEQYLETVPTAKCEIIDRDPGNPWAIGSRLVVAIYLEADHSEIPGPALTIWLPRRAKAESYLRRELLGGGGDTWDIFLAWRCSCIGDTKVVYRTLADVPTKAGVHGECPVCFYSAVRVVRTDG